MNLRIDCCRLGVTLIVRGLDAVNDGFRIFQMRFQIGLHLPQRLSGPIQIGTRQLVRFTSTTTNARSLR